MQMLFPRYRLFLYVDAAALEIVTHGPQFHQAGRGYHPALVRADLNLNPPDPEEWARDGGWRPLEGEPDDSFIRINASQSVSYFADLLDINYWYDHWDDSQRRAASAKMHLARAC